MLLRHLLHLLRLHEARHAPLRAHAPARHLHFDPRLHRRGRRRPHARARGTAHRPALHPQHEGVPPRRRQRDDGGMDLCPHGHFAHLPGAHPPEPAPVRKFGPGSAQGRLHPRRQRKECARRAAHRQRFGSGAVHAGERDPERQGRRRARRLHALHGGI